MCIDADIPALVTLDRIFETNLAVNIVSILNNCCYPQQ